MLLFFLLKSPEKMAILTFVLCTIKVNHELVNPVLLNHIKVLRKQGKKIKQATHICI